MSRPRVQEGWPSTVVLVALLLFVMAFTTACGGATATSNPTASSSVAAQFPSQSYGGTYQGGLATGDTQAGASFARWVIEQDPHQQLMTDAIVRGEQNLGVKVQRTATKADVQKLLMALTQGMARTFPGKPLTVIAFYQTGQKLAQADFNPQSGQVGVQFVP